MLDFVRQQRFEERGREQQLLLLEQALQRLGDPRSGIEDPAQFARDTLGMLAYLRNTAP